jgi:hypothetical protein
VSNFDLEFDNESDFDNMIDDLVSTKYEIQNFRNRKSPIFSPFLAKIFSKAKHWPQDNLTERTEYEMSFSSPILDTQFVDGDDVDDFQAASDEGKHWPQVLGPIYLFTPVGLK